jgi:hypothetical protein
MMPQNQLTKVQVNAIKRSYESFGKEKFYNTALEQKIMPYVAHALINAGCERDFWSKIHEKYVERNKKVVELLERIFLALNRENMTQVCVAENFATLLLSDSCIGCFSSGDVDLYSMNMDLKKLDNIMGSMGFFWSNRHPRKKMYAKEYKSTDVIGEEFWINFQWKPMTRKKTHLYDQRFILRRYKTFFNNFRYFKGTHIKLFDPSVAMYLNCIHIASGHYYILPPGIRLYVDIDRLARNCAIDWHTVRSWVMADHLGMRSDIVYDMSRMQLNSPIPDGAYIFSNDNKRKANFIKSLMDNKSLEMKKPNKGKLKYLYFLVKVELTSDGTNILRSMINRLWVILSDWG